MPARARPARRTWPRRRGSGSWPETSPARRGSAGAWRWRRGYRCAGSTAASARRPSPSSSASAAPRRCAATARASSTASRQPGEASNGASGRRGARAFTPSGTWGTLASGPTPRPRQATARSDAAGRGATAWDCWRARPAATSRWRWGSPARSISTWPSCTSRCSSPSDRDQPAAVAPGGPPPWRPMPDRPADDRLPPDPAVARAEADRLRAELRRHRHLYYVEAAPEITDAEYDALERRLVALEARWPELAAGDTPTGEVGADTDARFPSLPHSRPMLSLANSYEPAEVDEFVARLRRDLTGPSAVQPLRLTVEPKIDGVALAVRYRDGRLEAGLTRGDGRRGDVITANAATIAGIPSRLG
ncbi:hypothetical protein FJ250_13810, partial [bacterium]|nr:hypothetical protein [bacterium]